MTLVLRPQILADLPDLWRWHHDIPDAEWERWNGPYFHGEMPELSYSDYVVEAIGEPLNSDMRVIESGGLARGMVTRHGEAPKADGWLELGIVIYDPAMGARPLARVIERELSRPLADLLLFGHLKGGGEVTADVDGKGFKFDGP